MYFALQLLCRHREAVISVCKKLETEWAMSWVTKGLTCKNGEVSKGCYTTQAVQISLNYLNYRSSSVSSRYVFKCPFLKKM